VPSAEKEIVEQSEKILKGNKFAILATEAEETGFSRRVKP
jgi:hypothetical protein